MENKKCNKCKVSKPISEFHRNNRASDGHASVCKSCRREYSVQYWKDNVFPQKEIPSKTCLRCKETKEIIEFGRDKHRKDGHIDYCKDCKVLQRRERKLRDPQCHINQNRWLKYGLTKDQYDSMLESQGGVCLICKRPEMRVNSHGEVDSLAVDHDHETGKVRGLLCVRCNTMVGFSGDSPERLRNAADYLESFNVR